LGELFPDRIDAEPPSVDDLRALARTLDVRRLSREEMLTLSALFQQGAAPTERDRDILERAAVRQTMGPNCRGGTCSI